MSDGCRVSCWPPIWADLNLLEATRDLSWDLFAFTSWDLGESVGLTVDDLSKSSLAVAGLLLWLPFSTWIELESAQLRLGSILKVCFGRNK